MNNTIEKVLGENCESLLLEDDEGKTGGKSHSEETLGEFMESCYIHKKEPIFVLQKAMKDCGVRISNFDNI